LLCLFKDERAGYDTGAFQKGSGPRVLGADFYPVSQVARVGRDAAYLGGVVFHDPLDLYRRGWIVHRHEKNAHLAHIPGYLDLLAREDEHMAGYEQVVLVPEFLVGVQVDTAGCVREALDFDVDGLHEFGEQGVHADAQAQGVVFGVGGVVLGFEGAADVEVQREQAEVDGEAVAELVGRLVKEGFDGFDEVLEAAVVAAALARGGADLLDAEGGFAVGFGEEGSLAARQVVGVEFDFDAVHHLGYSVE